ncbi:hypothetical protein ABE26_23765 [Cytobacillus firmus]|nr:hypothetical protein [Cytobacillus firmus]
MRCLLKEALSKSCGNSGTGETPQARSVEDAQRLPRGSLSILERKSMGALIGENTTIYTKRVSLLTGLTHSEKREINPQE